MNYADSTYYTNEYLMGKAEVIPLSEFDFWAKKATQKIEKETLGKSTNYITENFEPYCEKFRYIINQIKECTCELAEFLYLDDSGENKDRISSESVGSWSASYRSSDEIGVPSTVYSIISNHLSQTGLMYKGVRLI